MFIGSTVTLYYGHFAVKVVIRPPLSISAYCWGPKKGSRLRTTCLNCPKNCAIRPPLYYSLLPEELCNQATSVLQPTAPRTVQAGHLSITAYCPKNCAIRPPLYYSLLPQELCKQATSLLQPTAPRTVQSGHLSNTAYCPVQSGHLSITAYCPKNCAIRPLHCNCT